MLPRRNLQSEAAVESAQTGLESAKVRAESAKSNLVRMEQLYRQDADHAPTAGGAQLEANLAQSQVNAALTSQTGPGKPGEACRIENSPGSSFQPYPLSRQVDAGSSQYDIAKSAFEAAQARLTQLEAGARSEEIAVAGSAVEQAQASLEQAQLQLANTTITSPIDGVVTQRLINPGEMAAPGQPVLILVQAVASL